MPGFQQAKAMVLLSNLKLKTSLIIFSSMTRFLQEFILWIAATSPNLMNPFGGLVVSNLVST